MEEISVKEIKAIEKNEIFYSFLETYNEEE